MRNLTHIRFHEDYSTSLENWFVLYVSFHSFWFHSNSAECENRPKQGPNWAHGSHAHLTQNIFLLLDHLLTVVSLHLCYYNEGVRSCALRFNLEVN